MRSSRTLVLALFLPGLAVAGDLSLGLGATLGFDLSDRASRLELTDGGEVQTALGPTTELSLPVLWRVADQARLVLRPSLAMALGQDVVTWSQPAPGGVVDLYSADHFTLVTGAGLSVGADVLVPLRSRIVRPFLGAELGGAWVGTYHAFGGPSAVLVDPEQNDLEDPNNLDPYTSQVTWTTGIRLGTDVVLGEGLALWFETGYSLAFVGARELAKTPAALEATREAFGWNTVRLGAGISFALGKRTGEKS